ncbi:hypothetical protein PCASD_21475 [Puccinia coronata f. sp. avenae]|uniref:Uncharacterized protein n=1 Tax=Puccinia coronata f. sp. avenae TaxID=200324 RepID=A0A2N5S9K0_9BASI|nr:hypothetical protein PCASD_21475 [Puccinia coronata f. sp. avenae]
MVTCRTSWFVYMPSQQVNLPAKQVHIPAPLARVYSPAEQVCVPASPAGWPPGRAGKCANLLAEQVNLPAEQVQKVGLLAKQTRSFYTFLRGFPPAPIHAASGTPSFIPASHFVTNSIMPHRPCSAFLIRKLPPFEPLTLITNTLLSHSTRANTISSCDLIWNSHRHAIVYLQRQPPPSLHSYSGGTHPLPHSVLSPNLHLSYHILYYDFTSP